jgi:hypothetical protein
MPRKITDLNDLMTTAAIALIRRDPERLEELERECAHWLQDARATDAQRHLLQAMAEAAEMLLDSPSDIQIDDDAENEE